MSDTDDTHFDAEAWLAQGRANADKLPDGVAEALGPEPIDYAAWLPAYRAFRAGAGMVNSGIQLGNLDVNNKRHIDGLIAALTLAPRPINDTVTDEWLADKLDALMRLKFNCERRSALRQIIAEATQ